MKNVVISADGDRKVYSVPDVTPTAFRELFDAYCNSLKVLMEKGDTDSKNL